MITISGSVAEEDGCSPAVIRIDGSRISSFSRDGLIHRGPKELFSYAPYTGRPPGNNPGLPHFIIFPGFIDLNVETTEGLAAINGGITFLGCIQGASDAKPLDMLYYFQVDSSWDPLDEDSGLLAGHLPYYISNDGFDSNEELADMLRCFRKKSITFRWEDPTAEHSAIREINGIEFVLGLIEKYEIQGRILVSTFAGLQKIREAKDRGVNVLAETHPHYLYFDTSMVTPENKESMQVIPPLRSSEDRVLLLDAFRKGHIDLLTSGHAPRPLTSQAGVRIGMPTLDTFGSVIVWLIDQGVEPSLIFAVACKNPGEWLKQFFGDNLIGRIKEDYEADITVIAFDKPAIDARQLYTWCGWSPFDIRTLRGSVETVFLRGEKVVHGGWMKDFGV